MSTQVQRSLTLGLALLLAAGNLVAASGNGPVLGQPDPVKVDAKTEKIIKAALKFLASKQQPNGAWGTQDEELRHQVAMTGYVLMCFQAAGQLPSEGEFGKNVQQGVQFLVDSTAADGLIGNRNNGQYMYNHGIAAIDLHQNTCPRSSLRDTCPRLPGLSSA